MPVSPVLGGARFELHAKELDPVRDDDLGMHPVEWFHSDSVLPFFQDNKTVLKVKLEW